MLHKKEKVLDNVTTTDTYQDSKIAIILRYSRVLIYIKNTGTTNDLHYKILATCDYPVAPWHEIKAETLLGADAGDYVALTDAWDAVKIQVKSAVAGASTTVDAWIVRA